MNQEITRHFTATTFIVRDGKVLLHLHGKQQLWLPPGGHIDRDELPHHAALREVDEETGLHIEVHSAEEAARLSADMQCLVIPPPAFILVEDINTFHQHIDFTYFARMPALAHSSKSTDRVLSDRGFKWFAPSELTMKGVPQNVKEGARRAVEHYIQVQETIDTMDQ